MQVLFLSILFFSHSPFILYSICVLNYIIIVFLRRQIYCNFHIFLIIHAPSLYSKTCQDLNVVFLANLYYLRHQRIYFFVINLLLVVHTHLLSIFFPTRTNISFIHNMTILIGLNIGACSAFVIN
jgi:hypothetical protein